MTQTTVFCSHSLLSHGLWTGLGGLMAMLSILCDCLEVFWCTLLFSSSKRIKNWFQFFRKENIALTTDGGLNQTLRPNTEYVNRSYPAPSFAVFQFLIILFFIFFHPINSFSLFFFLSVLFFFLFNFLQWKSENHEKYEFIALQFFSSFFFSFSYFLSYSSLL